MTDKHWCCNCYFGDMVDLLNVNEIVCRYDFLNNYIEVNPYDWSCSNWKEMELIPLPARVKAGFNRGNIDIWNVKLGGGFGLDPI